MDDGPRLSDAERDALRCFLRGLGDPPEHNAERAGRALGRITAVERWVAGTGRVTSILFKWAVAVAGAALLAANLMSKWGGE